MNALTLVEELIESRRKHIEKAREFNSFIKDLIKLNILVAGSNNAFPEVTPRVKNMKLRDNIKQINVIAKQKPKYFEIKKKA
jgi:hypothetical protein